MNTRADARTVLMLVDIQPDFMPGGALPVPAGDEILPGVRELLGGPHDPLRVATQDWHPGGHISFASSHRDARPMDTIQLYGQPQTLWPDHCVQSTAGAQLHPELDWSSIAAIIRKGADPAVDSYSGFRNNWGPDGTRPTTGLAGYLRERQVSHVVICGLARDFCVRWTAEDAAAAGFQTTVLWELTRPVVPSNDRETRDSLERAGVTIE